MSRVCLIFTTPGWRGSGVSFIKVAEGLVARGHAVRMVAGDPEVAERLMASGAAVDLVPAGDTGWREVAEVRRILAAHHATTVICDRPRDVRLAHYASLGRRRRIIWRYNLHSRHLATDIMQRWIFGSVAHIAHQSHYSLARLLADSPWLGKRPVSVIPNGFDVAMLQPDEVRGREFRRRFGIGDDRLVVVTPTPDHPEKELHVAEEAVRQASASIPLTWVVTTERARPGSSALEIIPAGRLEHGDLHDAIRAGDVILLPAPRELFGNVTAESMALGGVVTGADAGATPEVVGDAGALFRAGDPDDAARVIVELLRDPDRRSVIGAAARRRIATEFTLEKMQKGYAMLV